MHTGPEAVEGDHSYFGAHQLTGKCNLTNIYITSLLINPVCKDFYIHNLHRVLSILPMARVPHIHKIN